MKKILFIRSRPTNVQNSRLPNSLADEVGYVMPLGIASIAAYIREKGYIVSMLDAEAEELSLKEVRKRIFSCEPDVVGITTMTPTVHDDLDVAKIAKDAGAIVVMGGPQVNAMPEEMMAFDFVDYCIRGEGEYPMLKLLEALRNKTALYEVPGLTYRNENQQIVLNDPYIHPDLDILPFPARDLLPYEKYFSIISKGRLTTLCPGRGCPFTCGFCFKQPSDTKIRFRTAESVVEEIETVMQDFEIEEINFVSDTLTIQKHFIETFCHEIIKRDIKVSWIAPTRADCITPELAILMKKAGCRSLRFGVESGSPKILQLMGKMATQEQMVKAFQWSREARIETFAYLVIGYLDETEETIKETLAFVRKIKPDLLMYNAATPLPSTTLFQQSVERGLVDKNYWKKFLLNKNQPRIPYLFPDTEKWTDKAYRDFFLSPRVLFKETLRVRPSNFLSYLRAAKGLLGLRK